MEKIVFPAERTRFPGVHKIGAAISGPRIADKKILWTLKSGDKLYTPHPLPLFLAKRHFPGEGGGGVYFEAPRGRNFIRPPPFIHPPPLEGCFQGWGGGGV